MIIAAAVAVATVKRIIVVEQIVDKVMLRTGIHSAGLIVAITIVIIVACITVLVGRFSYSAIAVIVRKRGRKRIV